MTAVSSAALAEQVRAGLPYIGDGNPPYKEVLDAALTALDRLVAELDGERQTREKAERDAAIKDRAMTDYFADASRRADAAEAARDRLAEALNALDLAAGYYRRELKEILAHCEDDDQSLAISKIRAHAQDAIRAADASLAAAGSGGNTHTLDAIRDALAECLWDEEPWLTDDLTELIERVYVMAGGNVDEPPATENNQ